jgi:phosphoheptose isomerase
LKRLRRNQKVAGLSRTLTRKGDNVAGDLPQGLFTVALAGNNMDDYNAMEEAKRDGVLVYYLTVDDDDELYAILDEENSHIREQWIIIGTHTALEWGL